MSQDVCLRDGLPDDEAVVRTCKELLENTGPRTSSTSSSTQSDRKGPPSETTVDCQPRWGVCVLRAYQRLCCRALRAPTKQLYAFNDRSRKLRAAEAQLRKNLRAKKQESPASTRSTPPENSYDSPITNGLVKSSSKEDSCDNCLVSSQPRLAASKLLERMPRQAII